MTIITPVLLAGGSGTRLWPLSRKSYPKQFANLIGETSLFQQSAIRLSSSSSLRFASPITLTNNDFRFIVSEQMQEVDIEPGPILIEPEAKNTAPAILAASLYAFNVDSNAVLLVAPSDHVIPDTNAFHKTIGLALSFLKQGKIVTFGVSPTRAETGYGYLELSNSHDFDSGAVKRFVEKPDEKTAQSMLENGNFLWNSGIFMFRAEEMLNSFKEHAIEIYENVSLAVDGATKDLGFLRLNPGAWAKCDDVSIDYAIMEQSDNLVACRFQAGWSDLGGWDAVWKEMVPDKNGVVKSKNAHAINCKNTLLRAENATQELVGLGLDNILAVAMPDAVLVAHKDHAQNVKVIISELKSKNIPQAEVFPKDHRPWGWFETLALHGQFQVKKILVKPGAALSLQSHRHRSEHWIVVEGTAKVILGQEVRLVSEGESVYIPLGEIHRLENPGKLPMILIEVQTGVYLGEDDIVRYEDLYKRSSSD